MRVARLAEQFPDLASALRELDDDECWSAAARVVATGLSAVGTHVADSATALELRLAADAFAKRGLPDDLPKASLALAASIVREGGARGRAYECIRQVALAVGDGREVILRAISGDP